jgi:hypothetical protein
MCAVTVSYVISGGEKGKGEACNEPGDLPGEAPQKTQILMALLLPLVEADMMSVELGFRFERG